MTNRLHCTLSNPIFCDLNPAVSTLVQDIGDLEVIADGVEYFFNHPNPDKSLNQDTGTDSKRRE
ncbi:MAG: hypothetical protein ACK58N_17140 [Synechocystis sp.]